MSTTDEIKVFEENKKKWENQQYIRASRFCLFRWNIWQPKMMTSLDENLLNQRIYDVDNGK